MTSARPRAAEGGLLRTWQLRRDGWTDLRIAHAVHDGRLVKVHRGLFATADTDHRVIEAARHGGTVACASAARMHGLWVLDDRVLHVAMGVDGHRLRHPGCMCVEHWDGDRRPAGRVPSVAEALRQIACCQGAEAFFATLESALAQHLIDDADRAWLARVVPPDARAFVPLAGSTAGSGTESLFRIRLHRHRLPISPQPWWWPGHRGDFLVGDRLLVEIDSEEFHGSAPHRRRDLERDALAALWGFETLRFDYGQIIEDWPTVEAVILAKVAVGDHLRPR